MPAGSRAWSDDLPPSPGFTLIELLTVIAVLLILAAMAAGSIQGVRQRAQVARAKSELAVLALALEEFKRCHGDYPQLGGFAQAPLTPAAQDAGPGLETAQAKLFNCLSGVFGPKAFSTTDRINGPNLLDIGKLSVNGSVASGSATVGREVPGQRAKREQDVALLDPWGKRYVYYYKDARAPSKWQAPGYVLYSEGANWIADQPAPVDPETGLFAATQAPETADNVYANR